jgi:type VI protein secretion system component VasK
MPMPQTTTQPDSGSTAEQAKEQVKQQAEQTKQQVQQAGTKAKDKLRGQIDQRSTQTGERVGATAQDVRSVAEELRKQGKDQPARLAEQAADRVERIGGYLKKSDADRILSDIEDFGREKPWAVALGGLALGFAASRFLKASSTQRYSQLRSDPSYRPRQARQDEPAAETARPLADIPPAPRSPAYPSA